MYNKENDIDFVSRIQPQFTEYEIQSIHYARERTGESAASYVRRLTRLNIKGELIDKSQLISLLESGAFGQGLVNIDTLIKFLKNHKNPAL